MLALIFWFYRWQYNHPSYLYNYKERQYLHPFFISVGFFLPRCYCEIGQFQMLNRDSFLFLWLRMIRKVTVQSYALKIDSLPFFCILSRFLILFFWHQQLQKNIREKSEISSTFRLILAGIVRKTIACQFFGFWLLY
jgi:hypothetical protein